jgi:hypothetical protein
MIDLSLRESIRFQLVGTAFRRNISGQDIPIGDEIIPNGAFVVRLIRSDSLNADADADRYTPWMTYISTPMCTQIQRSGTQADICLAVRKIRRKSMHILAGVLAAIHAVG